MLILKRVPRFERSCRREELSFFFSIYLFLTTITIFTLSFLQTNTRTFVNSTDPDETVREEPSQQDLHCF